MNNILNDYRQMKIDRSTLSQNLGGDIHNAKVDRPVCVRAADVSNAIELVLSGKRSLHDLIEWVNVVWFTDLFYFLDKETDSIISVLEILETLDEDGACVSDEEMRSMQRALKEKTEYVLLERNNP